MSNSAAGVEIAEPRFDSILREIESALDRLHFLLRAANYTNQNRVARRLAEAIRKAGAIEFQVGFFGKPGNGADRLARSFEDCSRGPGARFHASAVVTEAASYHDIPLGELAAARERMAAVFVIPAAAPFFDETLEFLAAEFSTHRQLLIVLASGEQSAPDRGALLAEIGRAVTETPGLRNIAVCGEEDCARTLTAAWLRDAAQGLLAGLRQEAQAAAGEIAAAAETFATLLALPQAQYLRRSDYIRRDLDALASIGRRAHDFLDRQIDAALSQVESAVRAITPAMLQQAQSVVQQLPIPKETAAGSDARTRFGQQTVAAARAAGYREFDRRVHSIAMQLNSARSILLANMEQFRCEAQVRLEELELNVGRRLFLSWMREAGHEWAECPFELALDPGAEFPDRILAAAADILRRLPCHEFTGGWGSRLDAMLRNEILASATAGWSSYALEQPLAAAVRDIWENSGQRVCGLLVGRLEALVRVVSAGLEGSRLGSLQLPREPALRGQTAQIYWDFSAAMEKIRRESLSAEARA